VYRATVFECRHQPLVLPDALLTELASAYREPQRAYHDAMHIAELLRWFDRVADGPGWDQPADIYVALLFHDAIYVPGAKDNEAASAAWARRAIAQHGIAVDADHVASLIALTAQHGTIARAAGDTALFLDADMAIVGAPSDAYHAYARQIRREYAMVPAVAYRAGRGAFLETLVQKSRLYFTDYFHALLDSQARANLREEMSMLASGALD
jgi:predicted metal-dependent HD superfamily phosphohydrolase